MEGRDLAGNTLTMGGVFAYLMEIQTELTILLILTGLMINLIRIYDRFFKKNNNANTEAEK